MLMPKTKPLLMSFYLWKMGGRKRGGGVLALLAHLYQLPLHWDACVERTNVSGLRWKQLYQYSCCQERSVTVRHQHINRTSSDPYREANKVEYFWTWGGCAAALLPLKVVPFCQVSRLALSQKDMVSLHLRSIAVEQGQNRALADKHKSSGWIIPWPVKPIWKYSVLFIF